MRVNKIKTDALLTKQLSLLTKQAVYLTKQNSLNMRSAQSFSFSRIMLHAQCRCAACGIILMHAQTILLFLRRYKTVCSGQTE